jgi:hypothetical protein
MKLSEEMIASGVAGGFAGHPWAGHVAALEADLADANARAMELTARCDRERALRVAAEREAKSETHRADTNYDTGTAIIRSATERWKAGMAVVHFFDLARMDALTDANAAEFHRGVKRCAELTRAIPPVALDATSGGARGLDAGDGLARRRVTERTGDPLRVAEMLADFAHDIAERDARIEALERERDEIAGALACGTEHSLEAVRLLKAAHDIVRQQRDESRALHDADAVTIDAIRSHRDRAQRESSMRHQLLVDIARHLGMLGCDLTALPEGVAAAIARAERAEAVIAKAREVLAPSTWHPGVTRALAILDGKEGA